MDVMRNRILEIVVFLIDYMQGNKGRLANSDELSSLLSAEGYSEDEISSAYTWLLQRFDNAPEQYFSDFPVSTSSIRILSQSERVQMSPEAYGFLLKLVSQSLISSEQCEIILERAAMIGPRSVSLDHIKLIAASVVMADFDDLDFPDISDDSDPESLRLN